jgi:curved DNA-binding protein CbpA
VAARLTQAEALRILGLSSDAGTGQIKAAFREAALRFHPDTSSDQSTESARKFQRAVEAYKVAMRTAIRSARDRRRRGGFHGLSPGELTQRSDDWVVRPRTATGASGRIRKRRSIRRAGWTIAALALACAGLGLVMLSASPSGHPDGVTEAEPARSLSVPREIRPLRAPRRQRWIARDLHTQARPPEKVFRLESPKASSRAERDPNQLPDWAMPTGRKSGAPITPAPAAIPAPGLAPQLYRAPTIGVAQMKLPSLSFALPDEPAATRTDEPGLIDDPVIARSAGILRKWNLSPNVSDSSLTPRLSPNAALPLRPAPLKPLVPWANTPGIGTGSHGLPGRQGLGASLRITPPIIRAARREHVRGDRASNLLSGRTRVNYVGP